MCDFPVGLREIVPNQTLHEKYREITVNIAGGSQSTLQDIKLPDTAGGFSYADRGLSTKNRFIYWRTLHDVLELVEVSLDFSLRSNRLRIRFQDTPLLDALSIYETFESVIILVATVASVHKITFPHPDRLVNSMETDDIDHFNTGLQSIFSQATMSTPREHCHLIPTNGTSPLPQYGSSWLTLSEESIFVLANPTGQMVVVKLGNVRGIVSVNPLKNASYLGRIWGSIMTRGGTEGSDSVVSLVVHSLGDNSYVFALCKDNKMRMWSTSTYDCVMVSNVLVHTAEDSRSLQQGPQNHILRKIEYGDSKTVTLGVFLCFSQHSQFCVFKPTMIAGQFELQHVATIYSPEYDLVDFVVSPSHIWALWTNSDGENVLRYANYSLSSESESSNGVGGWSNVILEPSLNPDFAVGEFDPRQIYLKQLFHPGRFTVTTLLKTISIYRRCMDNNAILTDSDEPILMSQLKEEVCAAVESEIQNQVSDYEISDEEYISLSHSAWSKFYSTALQYHQTGLKSMGLLSDHRNGLLGIVKKSGLSFIRPVDSLEHLVLTDGSGTPEELFHDTQILCQDMALAQDVINLIRAIGVVQSMISEDIAEDFLQSLYGLMSPDQVAQACATDILTNMDDQPNFDFTRELSSRLQQVNDVSRTLEVLLKILELDRGIVSRSEGLSDKGSRAFSSSIGVSVLTESLRQMVETRFNLTRDILILQCFMINCGSTIGVSSRALEKIHSTYFPRSVVMAHCYFVLVWITETTVTSPPSNSLEQGLQRMNVLKASNNNSDVSGAELARSCLTRPFTLAELFLLGPGQKSHSLLTPDTNSSKPWHYVLTPLINVCSQLLWPKCPFPLFQEFLLSSCQYMQIQEYSRLLSTWCDWSSHSRQYLLGASLLYMGEPEKACDWMIQAAGGVTTDKFLYSHLFGWEDASVDKKRLPVLYFLKVIQQFEQSGYSDFVIKLANNAMVLCDENTSDRATLCYILFSSYLKLGNNNAAYDAMVANPDHSRRKDSLRQFIVSLFDRGQLRQLSSYPFIDMLEDLEAIIEARARSVDLNTNNYYDFLYSFHVLKENYRKAASVMYECGMRLGVEVYTKSGLKRQAQCLLACINSLKMVNSEYAWIVKPVVNSRYPDSTSVPELLDDVEDIPPKPSIKVLEITDILKEFELVCSRLKILNKESSYSSVAPGPGLSPRETVSVLVNANLYEDAIKITKCFSLDPKPIVEVLASRCVRVTQSPSDKDWDWIVENNPSGTDIKNGSVTTVCWNLLENIIGRLEVDGQSVLHKAVVTRLFSHGSYPPHWLVAEYKKRHPAELLRLYLVHGYLESAAMLALEYISAIMGSGKEYFGLEAPLTANSIRPAWLPYTALDHLLQELQEHSQDLVYNKLYKDLDAKLKHYVTSVSRISQDMIRVKA